ncbi:hypothetical protein [Flavobacterium sp. '19STA2R22 D10 B1']|uniref:hypothetical protein n=1 Tax=Flavobacterium aerium TaxID=3037261 RepID=UPI00278C5FE4|nr:hypothetical protein [Flavobacterium sp. '19STA2R22 D10 B1']
MAISSLKDQKYAEFTDLMKFTTSYGNSLKVIGPSLLKLDDFETVQIQFTDLSLDSDAIYSILKPLFSEIEAELNSKGDKYWGLYNFIFQKRAFNFTSENLKLLKNEIISCIKGDLVIYQYIQQIQKRAHSSVEFYNPEPFKIKGPSISYLQNIILKQTVSTVGLDKKWLVLTLDSIINECDYFYFSEFILNNPFRSDYDKVFLFDFYKGEIIELKKQKKLNLLPFSFFL